MFEQVAHAPAPVILAIEPTRDGVPTVWIARQDVHAALARLKQPDTALRMLLDLTVIDERERRHRGSQPPSAFTLVYHLLSFANAGDELRVKVPLPEDCPHALTIRDLWPNANWYECEAWDLFGIVFDDHPFLRRILTPPTWTGHPLRKDHYARATEMPPYSLT
ncbi:MAG: NADH-quinone oxidoreductase subunit C, partial [Gluconacetobacter sp.]